MHRQFFALHAVHCLFIIFGPTVASIVCGPGSFLNSSMCLNCGAGTFSTTSGATSDRTCRPCFADTYSSVLGAASVETCTSCESGSFSTALGGTTCFPCNSGTYKATGTPTSLLQVYNIFLRGAHARYTYESWNTSSRTWADVSGNGRTGVAQGARIGFSKVCESGNGATGTVCSVVGTPQASVTFGAGSIPANFTVCSVTRYSGIIQFQILNSKEGSFVHGHDRGRAAAASYFNSLWLTPNSELNCLGSVNCIPSLHNRTTEWVVLCGQNSRPLVKVWANGVSVGLDIDGRGLGGNIEFGVNSALDTSLRSNFGIMEIAVWNRFLTDSEMLLISRYYLNILRGAAPQYQRFVCSACAPGTYSTSLAFTACDLCGGGKYSTLEGADTLSTCQSCRAGRYSSTVGAGQNESLVCATCPPGSFSTATSATACASCAPGRYSTGVETLACALCLTGTYSSATGALSSATCQACESGTYVAVNGSGACTPCVAGTFSSAVGSRSSATCARCGAGTYSSGEGASAASACAACAAGTYSTAQGATAEGNCSLCQPGTASSQLAATSRAACATCAAGSFSDGAGSSRCGVCRPGSRVLPPGVEPGPFSAPGLYARFAYAGWAGSSPDKRPQWQGTGSAAAGVGGVAEAAEGQEPFNECGGGGGAEWVCAVRGPRAAAVRFGPGSLPPAYTVCSVTRYDPARGPDAAADQVLNSPGGGWLHGHSRGQAGVANYSRWVTNRTTPAGVVPGDWLVMCGQNAPPGLVFANNRSVGLPGAAVGTAGGLELALNGADCCRSDWAAMEISVWDRGLSEAELRAVSAYYASILRGGAAQGGVYRCARCGAGEFSTGVAELACAQCAAGDFSTALGSTACARCPTGTYSSKLGLSDPALCEPCAPGAYATREGLSSCIACAAGTYGTRLGATAAQACANCAAGQYSTARGAASEGTCSPCGAGTFSTVLGAMASDICTQCPAGQYSTGLATGVCSLCPPGRFSTSPGATGSDTCGPCFAGTYRSTTGGSSAADCTLCSAGTYSLKAGRSSSTFCAECGRGKYQAALGQSSEAACTLCRAGTYSTGIGMQTLDACVGCAAGTFSTAQGLQGGCGPCGDGSFIKTAGATVCDQCATCPIGQFQSSKCIPTANAVCLPLQYQAPMLLKYFAAFGQLPLAFIVTIYVLHSALFHGPPLFPLPAFFSFWWTESVKSYKRTSLAFQNWAKNPCKDCCWPWSPAQDAAAQPEVQPPSAAMKREQEISDATWSILKGSYDFISDLLFLLVLEPANPYGHFWIVFAGLSSSVLTSSLLSMHYNEPVLLYITSSSQFFHSGYGNSMAANINRVQLLFCNTLPVLFVQIWLLLILFGAESTGYSWLDWMILIQGQAFTLFNMAKNLFFLRSKLFGADSQRFRDQVKTGTKKLIKRGSVFIRQARRFSQSSQKSAEPEEVHNTMADGFVDSGTTRGDLVVYTQPRYAEFEVPEGPEPAQSKGTDSEGKSIGQDI